VSSRLVDATTPQRASLDWEQRSISDVDFEMARAGSRLGGLDLARGVAVIGMVAVNFGLLLSGQAMMAPEQGLWAKLLSVPAGDASATFVVLAGVGIGIRLRNAGEDRSVAFAELARRALALMAIGTVHLIVWPPDIIHLYGIMILASWPVFHLRRVRVLVVMAIVVVLGYPLLLGVLDYEAGWDFTTLTYQDNTPLGHVRRIFFNGYHPVVPWVAFLWVGFVLGRCVDLARRALHLLAGGLGLSALAAGLSVWAQARTADPDLQAVLAIDSIPPGPLYMAFATGVALCLIGGGLLVDRSRRVGTWFEPIRNVGRLALTLYFGHVAVGLVLLLFVVEGQAPAWIAVMATALFSVTAMLVAHAIVSRGRQGPMERLVRRIAKA
jgi:uncharacterized protein